MPLQDKNSWKVFFHSRWFLLVAVLVLLFLGFIFLRAYSQNYGIEQEISRLQSETSRLKKRRLELLDTIKYAESDSFVEAKARTELNLLKPGEKVAIIHNVTSAVGVSGQDKAKVVESENISNPVRWWRYFFGPDDSNN